MPLARITLSAWIIALLLGSVFWGYVYIRGTEIYEDADFRLTEAEYYQDALEDYVRRWQALEEEIKREKPYRYDERLASIPTIDSYLEQKNAVEKAKGEIGAPPTPPDWIHDRLGNGLNEVQQETKLASIIYELHRERQTKLEDVQKWKRYGVYAAIGWLGLGVVLAATLWRQTLFKPRAT